MRFHTAYHIWTECKDFQFYKILFLALLVKLVPEWSYEPKIPRGNMHFCVELDFFVLVYITIHVVCEESMVETYAV